MFQGRNSSFNVAGSQPLSMAYDEGLRTYMLKVMTLMSFGLAFTGGIAFFVSQNTALMQQLLTPPLSYILMFAPIGVVLFMSFRIHKLSPSTAKALFWAYAGLIGITTAPIFVMYTGASIAKIFFVTAGSFSALAFYGYTTKKDLTGFGSFLIMGVFGILALSILNMFLGSSGLSFAISAVSILVFAGLTAYDMQNIKKTYYMHGGVGEVAEKAAVFGALQLYIDFIVIFMNLLSLFGNRE